jgi:hypothetical protein
LLCAFVVGCSHADSVTLLATGDHAEESGPEFKRMQDELAAADAKGVDTAVSLAKLYEPKAAAGAPVKSKKGVISALKAKLAAVMTDTPENPSMLHTTTAIGVAEAKRDKQRSLDKKQKDIEQYLLGTLNRNSLRSSSSYRAALRRTDLGEPRGRTQRKGVLQAALNILNGGEHETRAAKKAAGPSVRKRVDQLLGESRGPNPQGVKEFQQLYHQAAMSHQPPQATLVKPEGDAGQTTSANEVDDPQAQRNELDDAPDAPPSAAGANDPADAPSSAYGYGGTSTSHASTSQKAQSPSGYGGSSAASSSSSADGASSQDGGMGGLDALQASYAEENRAQHEVFEKNQEKLQQQEKHTGGHQQTEDEWKRNNRIAAERNMKLMLSHGKHD